MESTDVTPRVYNLSSDQIVQLFQDEARRRVAKQLASGHAVYSSGIGAQAGNLYMHLPDGRRLQYSVTPDGRRLIVGQLV